MDSLNFRINTIFTTFSFHHETQHVIKTTQFTSINPSLNLPNKQPIKESDHSLQCGLSTRTHRNLSKHHRKTCPSDQHKFILRNLPLDFISNRFWTPNPLAFWFSVLNNFKQRRAPSQNTWFLNTSSGSFHLQSPSHSAWSPQQTRVASPECRSSMQLQKAAHTTLHTRLSWGASC